MLHSSLGHGSTPLTPPQLERIITQYSPSNPSKLGSSSRPSTASSVSPSSPTASINAGSKQFSLFKSSKHDTTPKGSKHSPSQSLSHVQVVAIPPSSPQMSFAPVPSSSSPSPPPLSSSSAPIPFPTSSSPIPTHAHAPHAHNHTHAYAPPTPTAELSYHHVSSSSGYSQHSRTSSSFHEDVLAPGDVIGAGLTLRDEVLRVVPVMKYNANLSSSGNASTNGNTNINTNTNIGLESSLSPNSSGYSLRLALRTNTNASSVLPPAPELEVVRRLGTGSYAIVYLAREVLRFSRPAALRPSSMKSKMEEDGDDGMVVGGRMDSVGKGASMSNRSNKNVIYGREFAVKCLSKANLDDQALAAQLAEATIHSLVPPHPNVVTLHRTLHTNSYLLLILEFVPGEDLFYFLKQARDQFGFSPDSAVSPNGNGNGINGSNGNGNGGENMVNGKGDNDDGLSNGEDEADLSGISSGTPPTPSLLTTFNPGQILSKTRLKLIASMFGQMCDAVAVCHDAGVFHRDIKPENFIVTDGWDEVPAPTSNHEGSSSSIRRERRVVVKLTDFGLSTTDVESGDMDCGSAPYMSYECRNNCAPTYSPRAADVWSLGIVLINLIYHVNPWSDTTHGECASFSEFRADPVAFWESHFEGMTKRVARFLAKRVFCILDEDDPLDTKGKRISAREFGLWVRDLVSWFDSELDDEDTIGDMSQSMLGSSAFQHPAQHALRTGHKRGLSISTTSSIGFSISSVPPSRRPSSRQSFRSPILPSSALSPTASSLASAGVSFNDESIAAALEQRTGTRPSTPAMRGRALSRAPSLSFKLGPVLDEVIVEDGFDEVEEAERRTYGFVYAPEGNKKADMEMEASEATASVVNDNDNDNDNDGEAQEDRSTSREPSIARKRKRGARRSKNALQQQLSQPQSPAPVTSQLQNLVPAVAQQPTELDKLASLNQNLVRELSRTAQSSNGRTAVSSSVPVSAATSPAFAPAGLPRAQGLHQSPYPVAYSQPIQYPVSPRSSAFPQTPLTPYSVVPGANPGNSTHKFNTNSYPIYNTMPSNSGSGSGFDSRTVSSRGSITSSSITSSSNTRSSNTRSQSNRDRSPVSMFPIPTYALPERRPRPLMPQSQLHSGSSSSVSKNPSDLSNVVLAPQSLVKKPSKWWHGFGKSHAHSTAVTADRSGYSSQIQGQGYGSQEIPHVEQRLPHEQYGFGSTSLVGGSTANSIAMVDAALRSSTVLTTQDNSETVGVEGIQHGVPSATAHNVASLLMGLNSSVVNNANSVSSGASTFSPTSSTSSAESQIEGPQTQSQVFVSSSTSGPQISVSGRRNPVTSHSQVSLDSTEMWPRGRRGRYSESSGKWTSPDNDEVVDSRTDVISEEGPLLRSNGSGYERRNHSPVSNRKANRMSGSSSKSATPSSKSSNWRNSGYSSHSSITTSSAFTRFSNSSIRSVSTAATSVSASDSWRNSSGSLSLSAQNSESSSRLPSNVKLMNGVPSGLLELPRGMHPNPDTEFTSSALQGRKQRMRKPKDLPTISERPHKSSPLSQRHDAHNSSTDLNRSLRNGGISEIGDGGNSHGDDDRLSPDSSETTTTEAGSHPRKVQKGQINALAKMLNAFRL